MSIEEPKRIELQAILDSRKTQKERNVLGQFATPTVLAFDILSHARRLMPENQAIRFLDPAIGTGSFYNALRECFDAELIQGAVGYEIDPHYGIPAVELWKDTPLRIQIGDFTKASAPSHADKANLIICNPPYVRHHHLDSEAKSRLVEIAARNSGIEIGGLAGLYCHFMAIAHDWLVDDGLAAWLVPSEFMDVNYGASIRKYLTQKVDLLQIHRFDPQDLQFGDAQVSSAVVWFRKRAPHPDRTVRMSFGGTLRTPDVCRDILHQELSIASKWSGLAHRAAKARSDRYKLADLFSIKRGIATGDNDFFVLPEAKVKELDIPKQFLRPVLPSPRYLVDDIVECDSLGDPIGVRRQYLLDCSLPEDEVRRISPSLADYLESGRLSAGETYICSRRIPWYSQEKRPPAPFVCTYMGRGLQNRPRPFRFIYNKSDAIALNVYLMLYPKPFLVSALARDQHLAHQIWRILNEIPAESLLTEGRVYGGGLYKMEPKELANVPADSIMALLPKIGNAGMTQTDMFANLVA